MSIDRAFDAYLDDKKLARTAEVVPDDPCQIFDGAVVSAVASAELADAEDMVRQALLGESKSAAPSTTGTAPTRRM
ncbi:hypothetical protein [uncultured Corynebacterium sp.]|uniref:hypothetical protein n=1 Tax=uncultured Corynebacterium sp. TaxID=159447 RepID=UPI0025F2F172|nr:hypothetical protein [uncultured Corynebacterium sp.]